jgi:TonB family protein
MVVRSLGWPPSGVLKPGSGLEIPRPTREVKPHYSRDAMRRKVLGDVWFECIVLPDGSVGPVLVVKSLDSQLDGEAVRAARQWRFIPGRYLGKPVSVLVTISMTFKLR